MKTDIVARLFRWISDTINGGERSILDALSAIVPYTTASIPAYMTYWHTLEFMDFPTSIAGLAAFTVEVLGVTAVSTAIRFWQWNRSHSQDRDRAPFYLAIGTYAFYIIITLSVNVILEVFAGRHSPAVIWAIGLFSLLSIPSGVLISVRAQFGEMLETRKEQAEQRRQGKTQSRTPAIATYNFDAEQFNNVSRPRLTKVCESCHKEFVTTFPQKRTCSDACRKRLSRDKSRNAP